MYVTITYERGHIHTHTLMEELQVLRDVTLFYNERHPELRSAVRKPPTEDPDTGGKTDSKTPARPATDERNARPATD